MVPAWAQVAAVVISGVCMPVILLLAAWAHTERKEQTAMIQQLVGRILVLENWRNDSDRRVTDVVTELRSLRLSR